MAKEICEDCVTFYLKEMPPDIYDIIIDKQAAEKKKRKKMPSRNMESIIYIILREWNLIQKTMPVIGADGDGDFIILADIDELKKARIINAMNRKLMK